MVSKVVKSSLCTGCGTCVSLCPKNVIKMVKDNSQGIYLPKIDETKCNDCGLCSKVCSGYETDYKDFNLKLYGKKPENILVGNYTTCYTGYSEDYNIRHNSSSGGVVTQLLIFALESKLIDGALITRMKSDNPLEAEPFIARTKEEIIEASTSKYCPVPTNIVIREILKNNIRCAIVGLPCHINGVRKAEEINKKLRDLIVLHIGLFCGYGINFNGTDLLFKWIHVEKKEIEKYSYRGGGWPGVMKIETKYNNIKVIPLPVYYGRFFLDFAFAPKRCLICSDLTCELSDISFGDAWLPEYSSDREGTSIIVSRNEIGNRILRDCMSNKKILLKEIPVERVIESQKNPLYLKKKNINARIRIMKENVHYGNKIKENFLDYFIGYYFCINRYLHTKPCFINLILNGYFYNIILSLKILPRILYSRLAKNYQSWR